MSKHLRVGIDEISFTLFPQRDVDNTEWNNYSQVILSEFLHLSRLQEIFGEPVHSLKNKNGYNDMYSFENLPWNIFMGVNLNAARMGIYVHFSAGGFDAYFREFAKITDPGMNVSDLLRRIQGYSYSMRVCTCDPYVDYMNYGDEVSVDSLHNRIFSDDLFVRKYKDETKSHCHKFNGDGDKIETMYIGSPDSNNQLCIYSKKEYEAQGFGFHQEEAEKYDSWTRFEISLHEEYAHDFGWQLLNERTDEELQSLIASRILKDYVFYTPADDVNCEFTKDLETIANGRVYAIAPKMRPLVSSEFRVRFEDRIENSGLWKILYFAYKIWGVECVHWVFKNLEISFFESVIHKKDADRKLKKESAELHWKLKDVPYKEYLWPAFHLKKESTPEKELGMMELNELPILTIEEAARLARMSKKKVRELAKQPNCPFSYKSGNSIRIKRRLFIEYLEAL